MPGLYGLALLSRSCRTKPDSKESQKKYYVITMVMGTYSFKNTSNLQVVLKTNSHIKYKKIVSFKATKLRIIFK